MEILEFILVYFIFTCSTIGYGNIFSKYLTQYNKEANIGFIGLYGFFINFNIIFNKYFFNHGNTHNYIILIFGIIFFLNFFLIK